MAKIIRIHPENPQDKSISEAVAILKNGGILIYPSDTVYAMGCDINNLKAMEKLARLKGQKLEKSHFSIVCNDLSHLSEYTRPIYTSVFRLLKQTLPGPYTYILQAGKKLPIAYKGHKTVGIRVPDHPVPQLLVSELGNPIVSTSIRDEDEILEYSTDPELIAEKYSGVADAVIDSGYGDHTASTVVDLTGDVPVVIRKGKGNFFTENE